MRRELEGPSEEERWAEEARLAAERQRQVGRRVSADPGPRGLRAGRLPHRTSAAGQERASRAAAEQLERAEQLAAGAAQRRSGGHEAAGGSAEPRERRRSRRSSHGSHHSVSGAEGLAPVAALCRPPARGTRNRRTGAQQVSRKCKMRRQKRT